MERELDNRLQKLVGEHKINLMSPRGLLEITIATLETIRAHILEAHSDRQGEIVIADTAIELVKGYR
ncbi:unnamed protein product [marine sediment metagenome]|uniref:Uncharacterized protein n=1 Tax=marine sediment metagenome TaxID=412755 RepID=X1RAU3_9ZZZZ